MRPKTPAKSALDRAFFFEIGCADQQIADLRARDLGHFLDADDQHDARFLRGDGIQALINRGRAGGAGILDARGALEAQRRIELQHQRGRKILAHEAAVEGADIDLVDIGGRKAGVPDRRGGDGDDHLLDIDAVMLAEFAVRPADHAGRHGTCSLSAPSPQPSPRWGEGGTRREATGG